VVRRDRVHVLCFQCADTGQPSSQGGSLCIQSWNVGGGSGSSPSRCWTASVGSGAVRAGQRVRSASAAFTAALAWSAPRTEIEAIVA
jgi:hypothetical protein